MKWYTQFGILWCCWWWRCWRRERERERGREREGEQFAKQLEIKRRFRLSRNWMRLFTFFFSFAFQKEPSPLNFVQSMYVMYLYVCARACVRVAISGRYFGSWKHFGRLRYHYLMQYKREHVRYLSSSFLNNIVPRGVLMSCGILHLGTISQVQFLRFRSNGSGEAKYRDQRTRKELKISSICFEIQMALKWFISDKGRQTNLNEYSK